MACNCFKVCGRRTPINQSTLLSAHIWGNLYSSIVLQKETNTTDYDQHNRQCGAEFCAFIVTNSTAIEKPLTRQVNMDIIVRFYTFYDNA